MKRVPPVADTWQAPAGFEAGARSLGAWLDATKDPKAKADAAVFKAIEDASKQLGEERKTGREKLLEDVALQRAPTATARTGRDALGWGDSVLYHTWRLIESLRMAAGQ